MKTFTEIIKQDKVIRGRFIIENRIYNGLTEMMVDYENENLKSYEQTYIHIDVLENLDISKETIDKMVQRIIDIPFTTEVEKGLWGGSDIVTIIIENQSFINVLRGY